MTTQTPTTLTDSDLHALGFSGPTPFGGDFYRRIGDGYLNVAPRPTFTVNLTLDDDVLFDCAPVATLADLRAVMERSLRALSDHLDEAKVAELRDLLAQESPKPGKALTLPATHSFTPPFA